MIRNYRLHVVTDAARELNPQARALCVLHKGTSIHVSNSIIRPEIHQYGTQVTEKLAQAWPLLLEDLVGMAHRNGSPRKNG